MADFQTSSFFLNPWILHFQKLGLELKCSLCLKLYNKPMLLPCDHIFCGSCVPKSNLYGFECPLCKLPYVEQDLRQVPFMENVVNIYKSLDASFSIHMLNSDNRRSSAQCSFPTQSQFPNQLSKGPENSSPPVNSTSGTQGSDDQYEAVHVDMNQMELFPNSSPSSGAGKGVDDGSCEPGSGDDTTGKFSSKKSSKRTADDIGAGGFDRSLDLNFKKQKQLHQGQSQICQAITSTTVVDLYNSSCTGSDTINTGKNSGNQEIVESDPTTSIKFICAFCHTGKISEGSGPMHHFANGRQVSCSDAGRSNVIHVHQSCIDWAPQTYYDNDNTLQNLDKELARAGKLKCTSCGLKGAALGCLATTCRRTYHAPCAYEITECRWDTENFLMLCPDHASRKFPSEKSKKSSLRKCASDQRHQLIPSGKHDVQKNLSDLDFWATSPTGAKDWILCGSALSADEKHMLVKFANLCGATVVRTWNPNVTHVIAATDANGACSRTLKVLMAILNGRWILNTDWIEACLTSNSPIDEEPYEIGLDNHGCCNGPKTGRLRLLNNAPKLFNNLNFYFNGEFVEAYKNDLQHLVIAAGGTIVNKSEELQQSSDHTSTTIVVYNDDSTGEISEVQRQIEAEKLALDNGSQVIAHTWILDSIASSVVKPFVQSLKIVETPWV